jgi:hypothetical protein
MGGGALGNTDIDGSPIVIMSEVEARCVYDWLLDTEENGGLTDIQEKLFRKIKRDLEL